MADSLGALQEQAAEIPYKNITVNTNAVDGFINAWQTATALKLKRQEMEGKMAALVARNRQLEINDDLKEKMMGMRMEGMQLNAGLREQQIDIERARMYGSAEAAKRVQDFRQMVWDQKEQDKNKLITGTEDAMGALEGLDEKDPNYQKNVLNVLSQYNLPVSTRNKIYGNAMQGRKNYYDIEEKAIAHEDQTIRSQLSQDLFGVRGKADTSVLDDPDRYFVQNYKVKGGGNAPDPNKVSGQVDPSTGKPYAFKHDKAGNLIPSPFKSFKIPDPNDPSKTQYKPIAIDRLRDYQDQLKANRERKSKLGERPHDPEVGVIGYTPTEYDIEHLRRSTNPQTRRNFEARFGYGTADQYLQNNTGE